MIDFVRNLVLRKPEEEQMTYIEENIVELFAQLLGLNNPDASGAIAEVVENEDELEELLEEVEEAAEEATVLSENSDTYEVVTTNGNTQVVAEFDLLNDGEVGIMKATGVAKYTQHNRLYHSVVERTRGVQKQGTTLSLGRARWGFLSWNRYAFYPYYQVHNNKVRLCVRGRNGLTIHWKIKHELLNKY